MTDMPPTKRRFWQIHLSTAVVLMVAATVLIWTNATPIHWNPNNEYFDGVKYGWPSNISHFIRETEQSEWEGGGIDVKALCQNACFDLFMLVVIGMICEIAIRPKAKP
jgi:hypothetical protein